MPSFSRCFRNFKISNGEQTDRSTESLEILFKKIIDPAVLLSTVLRSYIFRYLLSKLEFTNSVKYAKILYNILYNINKDSTIFLQYISRCDFHAVLCRP